MVVPVPGSAGLIAMHLDGQRVDVQRAMRDLPPAAGGLLVAGDPYGKGFVDRATLGFARQAVHQPPVRRLTGKAFLENLLARAVPDGQLHGRVVGQRVLVVLVGVAQGQAVQVLADQLDLLVTDALRIAPVQQPRRQVRRQAQAMIDLAEEQGPGVGSNPRIGLTHLDAAIKGKLE
jgi:hypothetical protein